MATNKPGKMRQTFAELSAAFALRPIRSDVDRRRALEVVDRLAVRSNLNRDETDYFETLSTLIEAYESRLGALGTSRADPIETLKYLMQGREMNSSDLGMLLGNRALGSKILRRERELSKANLLVLARHFHVSPALFLPATLPPVKSRRGTRAA